MGKMPPLIVIEPTARQKQRHLAKLIVNRSVDYDREDVEHRLEEIRYYSAEHMSELAKSFMQSISRRSDAATIFADRAEDAVNYIVRAISDTKTIFVGKSSTINELRPSLEKKGFDLIDSYSSQFNQEGEDKNEVNYPWQLPELLGRSAWDTFDYSHEPRQEALPSQGVKDIVALLAVNAASSEDGSAFFLQHSANIGTLLQQARRLILVVGLEKVVKNSDDALFQTRCAGAYGMESIILDLKLGDSAKETVNPLAEIPDTDLSREVHIIVLDNGRTEIARGTYRELLWCIGCRACVRQCAAYRNLEKFSYFPKEYLWSLLVGYNSSVELCAQCAMCQVECPVGINIPKLIARSRADYTPKLARKIDNRILMNMTRAAPLMSLFAPLVNLFGGVKPLRILVERMVGIDRRRKAPTFHRETFGKWFRSRHA
ncbi:LUD domain-containing protein [Chloroflexota bacterium]